VVERVLLDRSAIKRLIEPEQGGRAGAWLCGEHCRRADRRVAAHRRRLDRELIVPNPQRSAVISLSTNPTSKQNLARVVSASMIGTTVEWYDFFLYNSAADWFQQAVLPDGQPAHRHPAGVPDLRDRVRRAGRSAAWCSGTSGTGWGASGWWVSLLLMGIATFAIGLLPTYAAIGVMAPLHAHVACGWCRVSRSAASGAARC
jgi:hypothetical protein